ncbi:hypothetical protein FUAX_28260 [Fulvitalea axinellae]|uniref:Uncharacterized protein n=1 Tax=Fulvitalea axinellae TaxID=1182444 RepID=A0AAU9CE15_9BACT|nr:hypothetical protein FUAX_28260 [Fulvitalea axinellae]
MKVKTLLATLITLLSVTPHLSAQESPESVTVYVWQDHWHDRHHDRQQRRHGYLHFGEENQVTFKPKGLVEAQYNFMDLSDSRSQLVGINPDLPFGSQDFLFDNPGTSYVSRFLARRVRFGFDLHLPDHWYASVSLALDMFNGSYRYGNLRDYVDEAFIGKKVNWGLLNGNLKLGYTKVFFGMEEYTHISKLKMIERSLANNYVNGFTQWDDDTGRPSGYVCTPLGIGNRHVGLQWQGKANFVFSGFRYYLALTSESFNPVRAGSSENYHRINFYAGLGYRAKWENSALNAGVNFNLSPNGIAYFPVEERRYSQLLAYNPYVRFQSDKLYVLAEAYWTDSEHGKFIKGGFGDADAPNRAANSPTAYGFGGQATVAYDFEWIEPVARFSYLDTGGAGFSSGYVRDVIPDAPNDFETTNFDKGWTVGGGFNFTLVPDYLRLMVQYEFLNVTDDLNYRILMDSQNTQVPADVVDKLFDDSKIEFHTVRVKMQLRF